MDPEKAETKTAMETETVVETKSTDVEIKAAPEKAEPKAADGKPTVKTTLEIVKELREKRGQSRAQETAAGSDTPGSKKPAESGDKPETATKADEADEAPESKDKAAEEEKDQSGKKTAETPKDAIKVMGIDQSKPGWYDRLTRDQREALEEKFPGYASIVNAGKQEAQRYVEAAKTKADKLHAPDGEDKKQQSTATKEAADERDLSEAIDLLYSPETRDQGLRLLLTNKSSKGVLREVFGEFVKDEFGVDLEEQRALQPLAKGIELARKDYPQLDDDAFFAEVNEVLQEDGEAYEEMFAETKPRMIAAAIREASARVVRSRAARKPADPAKETDADLPKKPAAATVGARREVLERNTRAATEQAGIRAGAGVRPAVPAADLTATVDIVRSIREKKGYRELGGR